MYIYHTQKHEYKINTPAHMHIRVNLNTNPNVPLNINANGKKKLYAQHSCTDVFNK